MRLMLNGKLLSKEELMGDELIAQMLEDAKAEAKAEAMKDVPTKESIIQTLVVADIPEAIKIEMNKDVPTKESILQAITHEEVPEAVKQKIIEDAKVLPPVIELAVKQFVDASKIAMGAVNTQETNISKTTQLYRQLGGG